MTKPLRLYHFTPSIHGISNLVKRRVKISLIPELNDPFELVGCDLSEKLWRDTMNQQKRQMGNEFGLVCFSRTWTDPVQWGHYADRHQGICCGFDVDPGHATQVSYVRSRSPVPNIEDLENLDPNNLDDENAAKLKAFLGPLLFTKFAHWSYEDEFRMFARLTDFETGADDRKLFFMDFDQGLTLKEVIVGAESKLKPSDVADALKGYSEKIAVTKARPAFRSFKIVKQKKKALWTYPPVAL